MAFVHTLLVATPNKPMPNGVVEDDTLHFFITTFAGGVRGSTGATRAAWPIPAGVGDDAPVAGECELLDTAGFTSDGRLVATYLYDTGAGWELRVAVFGKAQTPMATGAASIGPNGHVFYLNTDLGGVATQVSLLSLMSDPQRLIIVASGSDGFYRRHSADGGLTWAPWAKIY